MSESYFDSNAQDHQYAASVPGTEGSQLPQHLDEGYAGLANDFEEQHATGGGIVDDALGESSPTGEESPTV